LFAKSYVPWQFHLRNTEFEPKFDSDAVCIKNVKLVQHKADPADILKPAIGSADESYTLHVGVDGSVTVAANSSIGLMYGLTTFTQLFYLSSHGHGVYTTQAPVEITDAPKFQWRGLNLDTARTFKPVATILAMIDALAYNKMNRLHWHITDSQAWPLEVPAIPELASKGAYNPSQIYSVQDVQTVQSYGSLLGVEVAMEFDNPGHTASIWYALPDLIAAFNIFPGWDTYAAEPPTGTLKLNSPAVSAFLKKFFDDLLPRLKPLTSYFHLGGDEVNKNAYQLDDTVRSNDPAVLQPLMQKYMDRNMDQVRSYGLTPLVWQEMLLDWNLTLPADTIVQTWISAEDVAAVTAKGYRVLVGQSDYWYLDCGHGQWLDFYPGASSRGFWPYLDYCNPLKNWRLMYSYDPLNNVPVDQQHLVLGGETHIWSEQTDAVNLDDRVSSFSFPSLTVIQQLIKTNQVWPRTCAAAEVLWSGAKDPVTGQNRSQILASPRLSDMRERLVARGIRAGPIQMPFCTQNGTQCAL
jgi:hexosaminidase